MSINHDRAMLGNAVKLFIIETFDQPDWIQVALETETIEAIQRDDRLFKALSWNDADYPSHAIARADDILASIRSAASAQAPDAGTQFKLEIEEVERVLPGFYPWAHSRKPKVAALFESGTSEDEADLGNPTDPLSKPPATAIRTADSEPADIDFVAPIDDANPEPQSTDQEIFLVHGHDHAKRDEVAAFVRDVTGLVPIILSDQPNGGMTIIEKFERHANVASVAIVLLTPDDYGAANGKPQNGRARQNVIFEMGYFAGRLSRKQVIPLDAGVEQPSDVDGLLYVPFNHAWKTQLRKELKAAGVRVLA